jgi:hypothetical protein
MPLCNITTAQCTGKAQDDVSEAAASVPGHGLAGAPHL